MGYGIMFLILLLCQIQFGCLSPVVPSGTIVVHEITYRVIILVFGVILFLMYIVLKWIYKNFIQYKLLLPTRTDPSASELHVYVEITSSDDKLVLYLMSIPCKLMNVTFNTQTSLTISNYSVKCTYAYLTLNWNKGAFIIHDELECQFVQMLYVPFFYRRRVARMHTSRVVCRLLLLDQVYYAYRPLCSINVKDRDTQVEQTDFE